MIHRIEISSIIPDTRAAVRKKTLGVEVSLVDVFSVSKEIPNKDLHEVASILSNPVTQQYSIDIPMSPKSFNWAIEIGFLPGVTDNLANTARESIEDLLKIKFTGEENVYSSQITYIEGKLRLAEVQKIADGLCNPLIQRATIKDMKQFNKDKGIGTIIPRVKLDQTQKANEVNLNVNDEELVIIGKKGIANSDGTRNGPLALDLNYMKAIQTYFKKLGRNPTDIELESIAQTWSEHCKHTIFADPMDEIKDGLFKTYIKAATEKIRKKKGRRDFCCSVFTDNSGAIEFDENFLITDKVETHNSPSALDPFGGAITGIVGVNRDTICFGLGAKPVMNRYGFCFADPRDSSVLYRGQNLMQPMLSAKRIMLGVIEGVNSGSNCSGIPTPQGFMVFDKRFKGKPLVFVGTVGLIPKSTKGRSSSGRNAYVKKAQPGDYIVMIGGRVGQDGIHGATFSSEAMDSGSPSTAVQIGDPITQKKLSDAIVKEARDLGLYNSITDNGAGGLSCSVAEMAKESNGCLVKLDDVPLKYPGLSSWQIWISESQERMTVAVPKNKWKKFQELMRKRGVEASIIGKFNNSGKCVVTYNGKSIMDIDMKFLHEGLPSRSMKSVYKPQISPEPNFPEPINLAKILLTILRRNNISGFEFLSTQYDHEVQGGSVLKPLQGKGRVNADASVVRPILSSKKGIVVSQGLYPAYSDVDTYHMAASSIDTAIRNSVSAGADIEKLALLDNFCWCSPDDPFRLGQLKRAAKACYDYAVSYQTPFISGKDSMFNDFNGYDEKGNPIKISVPPTLLISSIGVIDDITKAISIDFKFPGDLIYILGETKEELGGSEYFAFHSYIGNTVPKVDALKNKKLYKSFYQCVKKEFVSSAISVGRGGLGVTLSKSAMAGMTGIEVSLNNVPGKFTRDDYALFSETQGRIIVSIEPKNKREFEKTMKGNVFSEIGKVTDDSKFVVNGIKRKQIIYADISKLLTTYKSTFKDY